MKSISFESFLRIPQGTLTTYFPVEKLYACFFFRSFIGMSFEYCHHIKKDIPSVWRKTSIPICFLNTLPNRVFPKSINSKFNTASYFGPIIVQDNWRKTIIRCFVGTQKYSEKEFALKIAENTLGNIQSWVPSPWTQHKNWTFRRGSGCLKMSDGHSIYVMFPRGYL